jgi:hypothetical protein
MGEEFYCIIKIVSGEEILSLVSIDETSDESLLILQNPVTVKTFANEKGSYIKIKPWIDLSDDDFFIIKMDKIITLTETKNKKLIEMYNHYINDSDEDNDNIDSIDLYKPYGQVGISTDMGYISSVEDARQRLENLYKGIKES